MVVESIKHCECDFAQACKARAREDFIKHIPPWQVPKLLCCITDMSTRVDNVVWYMEQQTQLKRIQCHNCIGSAEGHVDTLVYT